MSYDQQKMDITLAQAADIATPADPIATARWFPGYQPILVRAVWAVITTLNSVAPSILTFKFRPTPGSAAGEVTLGILTIPINAAVGNVYYEKVAVEPVKCTPGGEVVCQTDGGGTAGNATVGIFAEHSWEIPANNVRMIAA
jgi:hypothetical protein